MHAVDEVRISRLILHILLAPALLGALLVWGCAPTPTPVPAPTRTPDASPTPSPSGTPTPAPPPSITVTAPNGGEVWVEGKTYRIRWQSAGVDRVNIAAASGGKDLGHLAFEVDADAGGYEWTIPEGFVSSFGPSQSDAMRIRIYDADDPDVYDENDDPFTVRAP